MSGRLLLVITLAVLAYAVWAYTHPWHDCWACGGTGKSKGSTGRRWGKCWRCRGRGELRTLGSRLMRRMVRSGRDAWRGRKDGSL